MKIFYNLLIIIALPFIIVIQGYSPSHEKITFITKNYCNKRYGFCISYPSDIVAKAENGDNSDGILLNDKAGQTIVNIYGTFNVFNENIEELFATAIDELGIQSSQLEKGSVSMEDNEYEFTIQTKDAWMYQKVILYGDTFVTTFMKVPKADKQILIKLREEVRLEIEL